MVGTLIRPHEASRASSDRIEAHVLGRFEVIVAGGRLGHADWQRAAAERLVKRLLVTPGHRLSREVAAETLWPAAEPEASRANLRKAIGIFERVQGRPFEVQHVPAEALLAQQQAAADPMAQSFSALMRCYANGDPIDMRATLRAFPVVLTSVDEYAAASARAMAMPV